MYFRVVKKEKLRLLTKIRRCQDEPIGNINTDVQKFWTECQDDNTIEEIKNYTGQRDIYGVYMYCFDQDDYSEEDEYFDYGIGSIYTGDYIPDGYSIQIIDHDLWAVFQCFGKTRKCIGETILKTTMSMFNSQYEEVNNMSVPDFELYSSNFNKNTFCEIWRPIRRVEERY